MSFTQQATVQEPSRAHLEDFVDGVVDLLDFVLSREECRFLWDEAPGLRPLAEETFEYDVVPEAARLRTVIDKIPESRLRDHGLLGRPMRFKLGVMDAIGRQWRKIRDPPKIREWFKRMVDAIDAALGSRVAAAGGFGGLIKEFEGALSALAKSD